MQMERTARAVWYGAMIGGNGLISTGSRILQQAAYSFDSCFKAGKGTSPEELLAASLASGFTMKLSLVMGLEGIVPERLETRCILSWEDGYIVGAHLQLRARAGGITDAEFQAFAEEAKINTPVCRNCTTTITLDARCEHSQ
jgi:osmotically inducible protein OsmC